jgi:osmotically-inducible protein OsmY
VRLRNFCVLLTKETQVMAQNYRNPHESGRAEFGRDRSGRSERWGGRYQTGGDRDRYETGGERRYSSDWDDDSSERGYEGDRSYSAGGYAEEFGHRRDEGRERQHGGQGQYGQSQGQGQRGQGQYGQGQYGQGQYGQGQQGSEQYGGSRFGSSESYQDRWPGSGGSQGSQYSRGGFTGQRSQGYGDTGRGWGDEQQGGGGVEYYGTGRHYGGGFGSAAGTRAMGGGGAWSSSSDYGESAQDWRPESGGERGYGWQRPGNEYGSQGYGGGQGQQQSQGTFRGRGPRGYERSDERLKEMVCERLTDDPSIDASEITIEVNQKVVKLTGTVDDRRTKYEVEELVERLGGVKDIDNQLRVQSSQQGRSGESQSSGSSLSGGTTSTGGRTSGASSGGGVGGTSSTSSSTTSTKRS